MAILTVSQSVAATLEYETVVTFWIHSRRLGRVLEVIFNGRPRQAFILTCTPEHARAENVTVLPGARLVGTLNYRLQHPEEFMGK